MISFDECLNKVLQRVSAEAMNEIMRVALKQTEELIERNERRIRRELYRQVAYERTEALFENSKRELLYQIAWDVMAEERQRLERERLERERREREERDR